MSKRSLIESIEVKKACSEDWDAMTGSDRVRFCGHCSSEVNNLSALTRKQAMRLVQKSEGRLCVRYVVSPVDHAPVFAGAKQIYQITRRAALAAGVFGASLSFSALAPAQNKIVSVNPRAVQIELKEAKKTRPGGEAGNFSGYVLDSNSAAIPNAAVILTNIQSGASRSTTTGSDGFYKFEDVPAAKYRVRAKADAFKESATELEVYDGGKANFTLEPSEEIQLVTMGEVAFISYASRLSTAVANDELESVRDLIARGENVNAKERNFGNITPLFLAVENGNAEIAETLLNFGARVNAKDANRQTPLMRLDEDASVELVELLIKHGARVNLLDREGNTALILAARSAKTEVLRLLIARAADVDARNAAWRTALMEAADADNLENVRALLAAGADANLKNEDGETACDLTTDEEIKKLLESYGAERLKDDSD
ncbi:MAG TPA: ankyrin repeat domain-containing protein [Pyrinomonadaceae bacterium]|jgi:hypothetical protein